MSQIYKQKTQSSQAKILREGFSPEGWDWNEGQAFITFSNGKVVRGSCIRCPDVPCMEFRSDELVVTGFEKFPADRDHAVCPTEAITWDTDRTSPVVDNQQCIRCGLCATRCPVGAISLSNENGAEVFDEENDAFCLVSYPATFEVVESIRNQFHILPVGGSIVIENDQFMGFVYQSINTLLKSTPKLPQHLTRNLFIAVGNEAAMRRVGDVNVRMEVVFSNNQVCGTAEVEPGGGILDAPRNLLDNVAVLVSRYGFAKDKTSSLAVTLSLPNRRTDYWNVVKDIKHTVDLKFGIITIGALLLLLWNRRSVLFTADNQFYADADSHSIRKPMEAILARRIELTLGFQGILECQK